MNHLMTWFGTVVCYNPRTGQLTHRSLEALLHDDQPVVVEESGGPGEDRIVLKPVQQCEVVREPAPLGDGAITFSRIWCDNHASFHLKADEGFLSARPGSTSTTAVPAAREWETFRTISEPDLAFLKFFKANDWWRQSDKSFVRSHEIALTTGFELKVGSDTLAVPRDLPSAFEWGEGPDRDTRSADVVLYFDGWRIEEFHIFRPLVVVVAYGRDDIFRLLSLSLRALLELGKYTGDILVIGDKSHRELSMFLPGMPMDRIHVYNRRATSKIDYYCARYCIPDWQYAKLYQPFLYMDLDVAVDRPIMPLFEVVASQDKMTFQAETWTRLDSHAAAGSALVQNDPAVRASDLPGFCSGIFTIPSLKAHGRTLRMIKDAFTRYTKIHGFDSLSHFDQPVANYVTVKHAPIDYEFLTRRVRYTRRTIMQGGDEALGFVHFWGNGRDLHSVMTKYIENVARDSRCEPA